jgi:hypothetical protein
MHDLSNRKIKHDDMDHEFVLLNKVFFFRKLKKSIYLRFHYNSKVFDQVLLELIYNDFLMIQLG